MGTKHPHYDLIIAWAEGEKIQWRNFIYNRWDDVEIPSWGISNEYRIKPETLKLSWKDVFDSSKKLHGHIDRVAKLATESGYEYFKFNGEVYKLNYAGLGLPLVYEIIDDVEVS